MRRPAASLEDKYSRRDGYAHMKGVQALARVMIEQQWRDRQAGHNTAGMITGYRGSPLGTIDQAMMAAKPHLERNNIRFTAGLNEDLAATALWGAQQVTLFQEATCDGVYGMWYGKGPGVDRCGDVFKHANSSGSSRLGGVICVAGDDHNAESSTIPHQTEEAFIAACMPVIFPAGVREFIEFGLLGIALSRYSGCWVGFTAETECVESSAVVSLSPPSPIVIPADHELPSIGLNNRLEDDDRLTPALRLEYHKLPAAMAFARANRMNRIVFDSPQARIGIVSAGKSYLDVREALESLGVDAHSADQMGIRLFKVGMTWPLEPQGIRDLAAGLREIIVVEEKHSLLERQIKEILYDLDGPRPIVVGKRDEHQQTLFQAHNAMTSAYIAEKLAQRLRHLIAEPGKRDYLLEVARTRERLPDSSLLTRRPFFCSGCPHNRSTVVPDGSRAMAGIGCHTMAMWMARRTDLMPQMGGEGVGWIGQYRYTSEQHVFANLGDGTYSHSGSLAIRAAVAEGVNITYKILFNDAVAMTGGQQIESRLTIPTLAAQLLAEGVERVCVASKEPEQYRNAGALPEEVELYSRDELSNVQRSLRETQGVTALLYDQTCAAELRRRRKRGTIVDPALRAFVNHRVCEGCGDCSKVSNCISIEPLDTQFGRKRQINQASCNKDITCADGFCPSFVLIRGGDLRRQPIAHDKLESRLAALPDPIPRAEAADLLICGTGGTGVITLGAILGVAAAIDGKYTVGLDQTGLAQKGGATASHVRICATGENSRPARIPIAGADTVIGCDLVVTASRPMLERMRCGVTEVILNDHLAPVADFVQDNSTKMDPDALLGPISHLVGTDKVTHFDADRISARLFGDTIYANMILLGCALQRGRIPLSFAAITRAIELNGVDAEHNAKALAFGRLLAVQPDVAAEILPAPAEPIQSLEARVSFLALELQAYQNCAYADRYRRLLETSRRLLARAPVADTEALLRIVAENAYKLMAYKDEYEVARLYTDGSFLKDVEATFCGEYRLEFRFAPPWNRRRDRGTKIRIGPWALRPLKLLASLRRLRGSFLDPFGYSRERQFERALIARYEKLAAEVLQQVSAGNVDAAATVLSFPQHIRGYGRIKMQSAQTMRSSFNEAWRKFSDEPAFQLPA